MATKKKTKKKSAKLKKSAGKKSKPVNLVMRSKKSKPGVSPKSAKKSAKKKRTSGIKHTGTDRVGTAEFLGKGTGSLSGEQSGDLQGLSRPETADSESVDELLEEGNAFEADAVIGVEDAESAEPREVHTHEVPEDDVPEEYLDKE